MKTSLIAICLILSICAQAQTRIFGIEDNNLYVEVNGVTTNIKSLILDPASIETLDVLKNADATNRFGEKARSGALLILLKKGVNILKFTDIISQYNLPDSVKNQRLCVDGILIRDKSRLLVEQGLVRDIKVSDSFAWYDPMDANSDEKFINIITREASQKNN